MGLRTIPIAFNALPGEDLTSWLASYAHRFSVSLHALLTASGVSLNHGFWSRSRHQVLIAPYDDDLLDQLAVVSEQPPSALHPLTLHDLEASLPLLPLQAQRALVAPLGRPRFCVECFAEHPGRWQRQWWLPTSTICLRHNRYLHESCPACDTHPLAVRMYLRRRRDPTCCSSCGTSLASYPRLVRPQKATAAQRDAHAWITDRIDGALPSQAAARHLQNFASLYLAGSQTPSPRQYQDLLHLGPGCARIPEVVEMVQTINLDTDLPTWPLRPPWTGVSADWQLHAILRSWDDLSRREQLRRGGTRALAATPTRRSSQEIESFAERLPAALWTDVALRIGLHASVSLPELRRRAIDLLLLVDTDVPLTALRTVGPSGTTKRVVTALLHTLVRADPDAMGLIATVARACWAHPPPINYARRRTIAANGHLISPSQWCSIARTVGFRAGRGRRLAHVRQYLYEEFTGGISGDAHTYGHSDAPDAAEASTYHTFIDDLTRELQDALTEHLRGVCDQHRLTDEPVVWSPLSDLRWPHLMPLPAVDSARLHKSLSDGLPLGAIAKAHDTTIDHIRHLIRTSPPSRPPDTPLWPDVATIVARLSGGATVRQLAAEYCIDRQSLSTMVKAQGGGDLIGPPRGLRLQRDDLQKMYHDDRMTIGEIALLHDSSPTAVAREARRLDVSLRTRGSGSHRSDLAPGLDGVPEPLATALHGRYGPQRVKRFVVLADTLSFTDTARKTGASQSTITSQLRQLELAVGAQLVLRRQGSPQVSISRAGQTLARQAKDHRW